MGKKMQTLTRVSNLIGTFWSVGAPPTAGTTTATVAADMPTAEITDASNFVRLQVWADFGSGARWMATGPEWQGGPGQSAPSLAWQFSAAHPPQRVYGVLENGTRGAGSPAVAGLTVTFS